MKTVQLTLVADALWVGEPPDGRPVVITEPNSGDCVWLSTNTHNLEIEVYGDPETGHASGQAKAQSGHIVRIELREHTGTLTWYPA